MEKLLKYYLSFILVFLLISCNKSKEEISKRTQAEQYFKISNLYGQGNPACMTAIEKAIKTDPTFDKAVRELSVPYLKRGMPNKWKPIFDRAVTLNPETWQGYRGYLYLLFYRDYKKAIADFNATDVLTPNFIDHPQAHSVDYWRGIAYLGLKEYKNSILYFDKLINKKTEELGEDWVEVTAFLYKGIAYYESGNFEKALISFDKLLKYSNGHYADGKYYKALIFKHQNKIEKSKEILDAAIEDYKEGYVNKRPYVEVLRQLYLEDYTELKSSLNYKIIKE